MRYAVDVTVVGEGETMMDSIRNAWSKVQNAGIEVDSTYVDSTAQRIDDEVLA